MPHGMATIEMVRSIMRTTVDIPDDLYSALKAQAVAERTSIKALLHEGARLIRKRSTSRRPQKLNFPFVQSTGGEPLPVTHENLYDFIDLP